MDVTRERHTSCTSVPAPFSGLAVVVAALHRGDEQLHVQEVVGTDGAQHVLNHPLGAGVQQVAELGGVRLWSWRTLKMSDIFKQTN